MKKDYWLYLLAAIGGAVIWMVVAAASGRSEAWDSGLYFSLGMPALCLIAMACAYLEPSRPWRWGVAPIAGQFVWMLLSQGPGNLLPLGVVVFGVFAIPPIVAAYFAASIAIGRTRRDQP